MTNKQHHKSTYEIERVFLNRQKTNEAIASIIHIYVQSVLESFQFLESGE